MKKGKIKFYNSKSGFGFITCEEDGKEYYFRRTALSVEVKENDLVTFDIRENPKGPVAVNIKKAGA